MAESAVTDRPATDTVTEASDTAVTEDREVTGGEEGVQAAAATDTAADTGDDPIAVAAAAAREAAIEEGKELGRQEALKQRSAASQEESRRQLREHYPNTVRAMETELNNLGITDPAHRQQVINHLNNYNLQAQRAVLAPFEEAIQELLPESTRDKFNEAADGKTAAEFQRTFAEFMADHDTNIRNRVIRTLTLEDFEAASAKNKAALTARDAAKFEEGRRRGRKDPVGEQAGEERVASAGSFSNETELAEAWSSRKITRETYAAEFERITGRKP